MTSARELAKAASLVNRVTDVSERIRNVAERDLIKDFGAIGDGVTDDTAAFQAAFDSKLPVIAPAPSTAYLIAGLITDTGGANIRGINKPLVIATRSAGYYQATGEGTYFGNFTIKTLQTGNSYQFLGSAEARYNTYEDFLFLEANSGIRWLGAYNTFRRLYWKNARGQCVRLNDATCHDNRFEDLACENGRQGLVLSEAYSFKNTMVGMRKWLDTATANAYILSQIVDAKLGADVYACVTESYGNTVDNFYGADFREGGITASGDRNRFANGRIDQSGASGVNLGGSENSANNIVCQECKNGFSCISQAGGVGFRNVFVNCTALDSTEIGFRMEDGAYRRWTPGAQVQTAPTAYCYHGQNIYQTSPRVTVFGNIPPTHTSGTVSDGVVNWQYVKSFFGKLSADQIYAIGCKSTGSGITDWYTEEGTFTRVACPGVADLISDVPHASSISNLPDYAAARVLSSPSLINGDFSYWPNGVIIPFSTSKTEGPASWYSARSSGAGLLSQVFGEKSVFAARVQRLEGDASTGSVYFYNILSADDVRSFVKLTGAIRFRAKALPNFSAENYRLTVHLYCGSSSGTIPSNGTPAGSTTIVSRSIALTPDFQEFNINGSDVVVPEGTTQMVLRFLFTPTGTAGALDGFEVEWPTVNPGKVAADFVPESIATIKGRLGLYFSGKIPSPYIATTGTIYMPETLIAATGTTAISDTQRRYFPISIANLSVTELQLEVTTAAPGVTGRMALYATDLSTGLPRAMIADGGEQSLATAAIIAFPITATVANQGDIMWIMLQVSGTVTVRNAGNGRSILGAASSTVSARALSAASASYGAPPASAETSLSRSGVGPYVAVRGNRVSA